MEDLQKLLVEMNRDLNRRFNEMDSKISGIEEGITSKITRHLDLRFEEINTELVELKRRLENQEKRLYYLEKNSVQRNIVFFGVEENENYSYFKLLEQIQEIIRKHMKLEIQEFEIESVRRIGKKGDRPRPISATFTTLGTKIKILKNRKTLAGTEYYIKEEFPAEVLKVREGLKLKQKREREQGKVAFIRYDKLVVKESAKESNKNKRRLSLSPQKKTLDSHSHLSAESPNSSTSKHMQATNKKYKAHANTHTNTLQSFLKRYEDA